MTTPWDGQEVVLSVRGLTVELSGNRSIVQDVSFDLRSGETLGLVGESGSGKSTTALALLGYTRPGARVTAGEVQVGGEAALSGDEGVARRMRGRLVSYVPQDPATSLNPSLRVGAALSDILGTDRSGPAAGRVEGALHRVNLPTGRSFLRRFPHELSGGQQQRVLIAGAMLRGPRLIVFDEPTTGLDVVTQARVLEEIKRLREESNVAVVYVSHDLAVVSEISDQIAVMYAGSVVEVGPADGILRYPKHPYTRGLVSSIPDHAAPRVFRGIPGVSVGVDDRPLGCAFAPRCPQVQSRCQEEMPPLEHLEEQWAVRCFEAARTPAPDLSEVSWRPQRRAAEPVLEVRNLQAGYQSPHGTVTAVKDVSFVVGDGECLALAGESGSGKTTIARVVAGLHPWSFGQVLMRGVPLAPKAHERPLDLRRRCQIVFQNPYESLNPRKRVLDEVARPARMLAGLSKPAARDEARRLLERVRLPSRIAERYPGELSGGERQRVAIARALAARPELLICDEITSALDVSVQAAVLELLTELRTELSMLFITHNLGVVASLADRVLILDHGVICEEGRVEMVFKHPREEYTSTLLHAAPRLATTP